jgi:hypothetical protein
MNTRAADAFIIGLAHVRLERADHVEMHPGLEPRPAHQRLGCECGAGDDVGLAHSVFQIFGHRGTDTAGFEFIREPGGALGADVPYAHPPDWPHRAPRVGHHRGDVASSHDQQRFRILTREI